MRVRDDRAGSNGGGDALHPSPLVAQLVARIVQDIASGRIGAGERLVERRLAEQMRVSRSPVRSALRILLEAGALERGTSGGLIAARAEAARSPIPVIAADGDEGIYATIADDRVSGRLADRMTENEFMRRYGLTKARLSRILRRMTNEGWIERLPGHGWEFLPVLTSLQAYEDSYRFRLVIEPAALLEPNFQLDPEALERRREQQRWLFEGGIGEVPDATLFEMNSGMHQTLIECSRNGFFIDALKRLDRLRRLIDYRQMLDRESARQRCREHVELLDLVLAGRRIEASDYLRRHLAELSTLKTRARNTRRAEAPSIGDAA